MEKNYLICFDNAFNGITEIQKLFKDLEPAINDWRSDIPNICYVKSTNSASEIAQKIHNVAIAKAKFFICEINENCDGFVTEDTWLFIFRSHTMQT